MCGPDEVKNADSAASNHPAAAACWQSFLDGLPLDSPYRQKTYLVESWGDNPALADELGRLIADGTKTATCSALIEYEMQNQPLPEPGLLTVVIDGRGTPLGIVETSTVRLCPFNQVSARFAFEEGEGDRSLAYWRREHRRYFTRTLGQLGLDFQEDLTLVCERFRLIYRVEPG